MHTPGPWEIIGRHIYQVDEVGGRGVLHGASVKGQNEKEIEANIRLVAAAPDLLKALEHCVISLKALGGRSPDTNSWADTGYDDTSIKLAEQAIAKAKEISVQT